jgi:uncharacterized protein YegL
MEALVKTLRTDPHALESVYLSTIVFAGKASGIDPVGRACKLLSAKATGWFGHRRLGPH